MDGMWYKHCPDCGNYLKKTDPQEAGMCYACGWEEYDPPYYCEVRHCFCTANTDADRSSPPEELHVPSIP